MSVCVRRFDVVTIKSTVCVCPTLSDFICHDITYEDMVIWVATSDKLYFLRLPVFLCFHIDFTYSTVRYCFLLDFCLVASLYFSWKTSLSVSKGDYLFSAQTIISYDILTFYEATAARLMAS